MSNTRFKRQVDPSDQGSLKGASHFGQTQPLGFADGNSKQIPEESVADPRVIPVDTMHLNFSGLLECGEVLCCVNSV